MGKIEDIAGQFDSLTFLKITQGRRIMASLATTGFTIVELLIVIVVIGILAALVLNSVATAKQSALNAQTIDAAQKWTQALQVYKVTNGSYPAIANGNPIVCLEESLPANSDFAANACGNGYTVDSTMNGLVNQYTKFDASNDYPTHTLLVGRVTAPFRGLLYGMPLSGSTPIIGYLLYGNNASCGKGQASASATLAGISGYGPDTGQTYCEITLQ